MTAEQALRNFISKKASFSLWDSFTAVPRMSFFPSGNFSGAWKIIVVSIAVWELPRRGPWTEKDWNMCLYGKLVNDEPTGTSRKMRIYWKVVTFLVLLCGSYRVRFRGIKYPKVEFNMGTSQSTWKVTNKVPKRRQSNTAKNGSLARGHKFKSESNLLDEVRAKNVQTNPLYRHQEIFDNDLFFEEILAKIEQEAAKLSNSDKHSESPKGFDSFMLYWLKSSLRDNPRYRGKIC